ncbi:hypothetical protein BASA62_005597 [Batrachochytrium salamandrivorans]|nr:hypothetical protein BASA62_005597 [Batrachochytrium salamandrivorans]
MYTPSSTTFSYASFETNMPKQDDNYAGLLDTVLAVFSPKTCTVGLFSDSNHQACSECREDYGYRRISHESARIQNLFFGALIVHPAFIACVTLTTHPSYVPMYMLPDILHNNQNHEHRVRHKTNAVADWHKVFAMASLAGSLEFECKRLPINGRPV